jgi:hypothetical protein
MLRLRSEFVSRLGRYCSVGQRTCHRTTLTAEGRVVLTGLRPGNRAGGERHSRSGEGGRGEDAGVADADAAGAGRDDRSGVQRRVVLVVLGLFRLRCAAR